MAVVQISKIQLRRGQKNSQSGIPQLSSAEMAWAVDTQELFIGNGSVAEGAPYVGNTKILTEHDNLLSLISGYRFGNDDFNIINSVTRSLQGKLDEIEVSVRDYGAIDDGSTDTADAFDRALKELYINSETKFKKVLKVPNGRYLFLRDIEIPSDTVIEGETKEGVELILGNFNIRFLTDTGQNQSFFTSGNVPRNIKISNLTISRISGQIDLTGVRESIFENVIFKGNYSLTDGNSTNRSTEPSALFWQNFSVGTATTDNTFKNCQFEFNKLSIKCLQNSVFETRINFESCDFFVNASGIYVQGVTNQRNSWSFNRCNFEEIFAEAIEFTQGRNTLISNSNFVNCSNGTGSASSPSFNIIKFGQFIGNVVKDCLSNRQQNAGIVTSSTSFYLPEVENASQVSFINRNYSNVSKSDSYIPLSVLSANSRYIKIDYILRLSNHSRFGLITISINDDLTVANLQDDYTYSDLTPSSTGGSLMTNFEFDVELRDNNADSVIETLVLLYRNPLLSGATGDISFNVSYGV
jgi:hypothetical protein